MNHIYTGEYKIPMGDDIVTNSNMPYRNMTSKEYINKLKVGEI